MTLAIPEGMKASEVRVTLDGRPLPHEFHHQDGATAGIQLKESVTLNANATLQLRLALSGEAP